MMDKYDVIVVGAGPAGLMAAGQAALLGCNTLLLEKMEEPGRKLLLTGKTRCNITNTATLDETLLHFNKEGRFLKDVFHRFFNTDTREFFHSLGVPTSVQRGGRVFPRSERSQDVLKALLDWNQGLGVILKTRSAVSEILIDDNKIIGVKTKKVKFLAPKVILSTGGKAYPGTGSTGDGYLLSKKLGHSIIPQFPSLVPIRIAGEIPRRLQGLNLDNVEVNVWSNNKKIASHFGDMLFTHFGVSGPSVLSLSKQIVLEIEQKKNLDISIDLKPALDRDTLDARLLRDIQTSGKKQYKSLLKGLLPNKLIPVCVEQTEIPDDKKLSQLSSQDRTRLLNWLKEGFRLRVTGHQGFDQAIITSGGVDTSEVNPQTMESKLIKGLYFAGEILNIDADTGGFNLQAAFSTGWAAGRSAGRDSAME